MFNSEEDTTVIPITIRPKNADTRWVTLDLDDKIISEGKTPDEAIEKAKKSEKPYTLMFIPLEGNTYIF